MLHTLRFCNFSILLLLLPGLHSEERTDSTIFRTTADMVLVPVAVRDHDGKTISGLGAENFIVFDDRKPQRILSFVSGDAPCSLGLVLDISGSMRYLHGATSSIARTVFLTANPDDEFLLLTVSTNPAAGGFTRDVLSLESRIESMTSGGLTALIDTVYLGLRKMRTAKHASRALLIVSDGLDNHSRYSARELMREAIEADAQVYTILVNNGLSNQSADNVLLRTAFMKKPWDQGPERQGPLLLRALSEKTGGIFLPVRNDGEARTAVAKIGEAIRNHYVIGYQPTDSGERGKWHRITVKSNVPRANTSARWGYYSR
jgi:Ca-activated chloride channel family protein